MAITSAGYDGSVSELSWSKMISGVGSSEYGVLAVDDYKVTPVTGADRTVSISAGSAWGKGVFDINDANITIQLDTVSTGSRYDMIVIRRNWTGAAGTTTIAKINGSASKSLPARNVGAGALDDQPIALVQITAGQTQPTAIIDLRAWGSNGGMVAADALALSYLQRPGAQVFIAGETWQCTRSTSGAFSWNKVASTSALGLYGAGGNISGLAVPNVDAGPNFMIQAGSTAQYTDGSGYGRVTWPKPFPNGLLTVILTNGDSWMSGGGVMLVEGHNDFWGPSGNGGKNDVVYVFQGNNAQQLWTLKPNTLHRVNWIAIGY